MHDAHFLCCKVSFRSLASTSAWIKFIWNVCSVQPLQRNSKELSQQRVSHSQQCQLRGTSLSSQPKPLLQYLARPNLCAQHLTSLGQLKIRSQELVGSSQATWLFKGLCLTTPDDCKRQLIFFSLSFSCLDIEHFWNTWLCLFKMFCIQCFGRCCWAFPSY